MGCGTSSPTKQFHSTPSDSTLKTDQTLEHVPSKSETPEAQIDNMENYTVALNGYFNPKNDVVWADIRGDANERGGVHEKEKFPVSVMVALGATWNGLTEPYFFANEERLNGTAYYEELLPFYKEEGSRLFGHQNWGFQ
ncbi:unnamed protein product [Rotaria sordida]|uniref:Uncharacterized protein n=1 Tax=Rotaria sordida TaxID=392033 RepID=A0A814Y007_9BILA|nr:unnamed protein product [Rotaria sordida]CAF3805763.1 unnamed protein product [Rotaria sordida]